MCLHHPLNILSLTDFLNTGIYHTNIKKKQQQQGNNILSIESKYNCKTKQNKIS